MLKYLIIDDEYIAHEIIQEYAGMLPNLELVKNCYDALEALTYLQSHQVDLIFLDLNMPKIKGFEFLRTLSNPPQVIVTTAYQEYALEGYELNVVDYLLKPFSFERFLKAMNKVTNATTSKKIITPTEKLNESKDTLFLRSNKKYTQVQIQDILFLEAAGNYSKVQTLEEQIMVRVKISDLLKQLPKANFLQTHKSFVVSIKHIRNIEGNRIFIKKHIVPIGKLYKMQVLQLLQ